ncbi:MAG: plasmid stabilization protein [Candidatus Muproteobacteria bacterium RBG_16_64_11]|uniref:Plasmid stabilization protein n=1 Tax=Candidatus Muproteobacteria bacterium RBG_16_64_11 TaxID=1817758 RepID=A0A1F6T9N6_9PROT|nr:MAG: plasmid stabilization protein [Candidatus Muproteobacteria bacterium RBG_16_64_11]
MAQTLIWSHEALDDIDRIAEYISRDSPAHAQQVVERLLDFADELPAHPKLGRVVPELADPNVRERFLYSYRLIYELTGNTIHVLAVIHGKRLLESVERL